MVIVLSGARRNCRTVQGSPDSHPVGSGPCKSPVRTTLEEPRGLRLHLHPDLELLVPTATTTGPTSALIALCQTCAIIFPVDVCESFAKEPCRAKARRDDNQWTH